MANHSLAPQISKANHAANKNDIPNTLSTTISSNKITVLSGLLLLITLVHTALLPTIANAQQRSPDHQRYCLRLEGELAKTYQRGNSAGVNRAKLKLNIRNVERVYHRLNSDADRRQCYSHFLFSKELRRTPRCIRIHKKIINARRQLERLNRKLENSINSRGNKQSQRSDLIRALARNKCGRQYEREDRKRNSFNNWFDDGFFGGNQREPDHNPQDQFRFATHRTLCVRLCDGYYFPMSFATTTNRFSTDEAVCQSKCAAPAKLFSYPNPGGDPQQMQSITGAPYGELKNAWRFKKEFVKGCSCKAAEYNPVLLEAKPKTELSDTPPKDDLKDKDTPADTKTETPKTENPSVLGKTKSAQKLDK